MKITADAKVLVRVAVQDDAHQARRVGRVLCSRSAADVASAIHRLINRANLVTNRLAVEAGLSVLEAGGDFADGVIAYEGNWPGAEELLCFDSKAISGLQALGGRARLLA